MKNIDAGKLAQGLHSNKCSTPPPKPRTGW